MRPHRDHIVPDRLPRLLWNLAIVLPPVLLLGTIAAYAVDVPFMDQWDLVALFDKVADGRATFADYWAPNNRVHRVLLPKLIATQLAFRTGWDVRCEMYLSFVAALGTFALLYVIVRRTVPGGDSTIALATTSWLVFSLHHYQLWLCGFQFAWALVNLCTAGCVYFLTAPAGLRPAAWVLRMTLAAACCAAAMVCQLHGSVSWVAGLVLLATAECRPRLRRGMLVAWLAVACACTVGTVAGLDLAERAAGGSHIRAILVQFLVVLGDLEKASVPLGASVGGILLIALALLLRQAVVRNGLRPVRPWLAFGCFGVVAAAVIAIGRHSPQGYWMRWSTVPMFLWLALVHLARLASCDKPGAPSVVDGAGGARRSASPADAQETTHRAMAPLIRPIPACLFAIAVIASLVELPTICGWWWPNMAAGRATLTAMPHIAHPNNHEGLRWLYVYPELLPARFAMLERLGLRSSSATLEPARPIAGTITEHHTAADATTTITVTIADPAAPGLAEPVIAFVSADKPPRFVASGVMAHEPTAQGERRRTVSLRFSAPRPHRKFEAWILDASAGRLLPITIE